MQTFSPTVVGQVPQKLSLVVHIKLLLGFFDVIYFLASCRKILNLPLSNMGNLVKNWFSVARVHELDPDSPSRNENLMDG